MTAFHRPLAAAIAEQGIPLTADMAAQSARQQECEASLATIVAALDRPLGFEECDALRLRVEQLYAALAALEAATTVEWGVRLVDGGWTSAKRSHETALEDIRGLRAHGEDAVLVTRTVSHGAWTEVKP